MSDKKTSPRAAASAPKLSPKLKQALDHWLVKRSAWNHQDWLDLLAHLRNHSLGESTLTQDGRDSIGHYLETHRH